jgi:hypothetical protein
MRKIITRLGVCGLLLLALLIASAALSNDAPGTLLGDRAVMSDGVLMSDVVFMSDGVVMGDSVLTLSGVLMSDIRRSSVATC